jgi:hypothetical protein
MVSMQAVLPLIVTNALSALGAIVILLIGLWLSGKGDQLVVRVLSRTPHFRPDREELLRQPRALPDPDRHSARGAVAIRHPDDAGSPVVLVLPDNSRDPELTRARQGAHQENFAKKTETVTP